MNSRRVYVGINRRRRMACERLRWRCCGAIGLGLISASKPPGATRSNGYSRKPSKARGPAESSDRAA